MKPCLLRLSRVVLVGLAALSCLPAVQARNTMLLLDIEPVLRHSSMRQALGQDVVLHFGVPAPENAELLGQQFVEGHGLAKPATGQSGQKQTFRPDEKVCEDAFRMALVQLVEAARQAGGTAVVGVVSAYPGSVIATPKQYECHAGQTRAVVDLKGRVAKWSKASATNAARASPGPHRKQVPAASDFAATDNADAMPLRDAGKDRYRHYLTLASPKAFVIYESGGWRFVWNDADAMTKVLDHCANAGKRCWLYAVDDRVVWDADVAKRIGSSAQLMDK